MWRIFIFSPYLWSHRLWLPVAVQEKNAIIAVAPCSLQFLGVETSIPDLTLETSVIYGGFHIDSLADLECIETLAEGWIRKFTNADINQPPRGVEKQACW